MTQWLAQWGPDYQALKLWLMDLVPLAKDAMHIHICLAIFIVVRLLWRRRGGWLAAWLAALAAALGGEFFDIVNEGADPGVRSAFAWANDEHWKDIWNGMLWPTLLALIGRWLHVEARGRRPSADPPPPARDLADQRGDQPGE